MCVPYCLALHLNSWHWVWCFWGWFVQHLAQQEGKVNNCEVAFEITTVTCIFPVARVKANTSFLLGRKQSPGCWSDARTGHNADKAEGRGGPRVGSEQPDIPNRAEGTKMVLSNVSSKVQTVFWKTSFQWPQRVQNHPSHFPTLLFMTFITTLSHRPREKGFREIFFLLAY